jgi:hypothetical protein
VKGTRLESAPAAESAGWVIMDVAPMNGVAWRMRSVFCEERGDGRVDTARRGKIGQEMSFAELFMTVAE